MALKIRRGTESQRGGITFAAGELIWTTNGHKLYVGDGITAGGIDIASQLGGSGVNYNQSTGKLDLHLASTNSDSLNEGTTNQYFTPARAQAAVATALTNGNPYNTGITFLYDDVDHRITATVTGGGGGTTLPSQSGHSNQYLKTDGSGNLSWATPPEGITAISQDGNPLLGANLGLNGHNVTGSGNINITGTVTSTTVTASNLSFTNNTLSVSNGSLYVENNAQQIAQVRGVSADGTPGSTPQFNIFSSRGTIASPTNSQPGDWLMNLSMGGYHGGGYIQTSGIASSLEATATMTDSNPGATLYLNTNNNNGGLNTCTFNSKGAFRAPIFQASSYSTSQINGYPAPEAGMIVFNSTTNHFMGYNGTSWVSFTGP